MLIPTHLIQYIFVTLKSIYVILGFIIISNFVKSNHVIFNVTENSTDLFILNESWNSNSESNELM